MLEFLQLIFQSSLYVVYSLFLPAILLLITGQAYLTCVNAILLFAAALVLQLNEIFLLGGGSLFTNERNATTDVLLLIRLFSFKGLFLTGCAPFVQVAIGLTPIPAVYLARAIGVAVAAGASAKGVEYACHSLSPQ